MSPGLMGQRSALHYSYTPSSSARLLFLPPSIPASVPLCGRSYESVLARRLVRRGDQTSNQPTNTLMNETPRTFSQGTRCKLKMRGKINPNIPNSAQSTRSHTARKPNSQRGARREEERVWFSKEKQHHCRVRAKTGGKNLTEERQT